MSGVFLKPKRRLYGQVLVPGDKSISHRAALFGGLARGQTRIKNFLAGEDCLSTLRCLRALGVRWEQNGTDVWLESAGIDAWREPDNVLDVGNSGTTIRLLLGAFAGCPLAATLTGDASIRRRPMRRVTEPLRMMGAQILGREQGNLAPLTIVGGGIQGCNFSTPVASAQIKSALLLAGLRAKGETTVTEPARSRDHTERLLRGFGVDVRINAKSVTVFGGAVLTGQEVVVPGDISSAAFFLVLGSLGMEGEIVLPGVGVNPTRTGIIDALRAMGADIAESGRREVCGEPMATLSVRPAALHGTEIGGELIPRLIDELPVLAVAACFAAGETVVRDAAELRVKETDRIKTVVAGLRTLGAQIEELPDGFRVVGRPALRGGAVASYGDHRLAMAWAIAGVLSQEGVSIDGIEAAAVSYPGFLNDLARVTG